MTFSACTLKRFIFQHPIEDKLAKTAEFSKTLSLRSADVHDDNNNRIARFSQKNHLPKLAQSRFEVGSPVKITFRFWQGFNVLCAKIHIIGSKYHFIGVALKTARGNIIKVAYLRGKTATWQP